MSMPPIGSTPSSPAGAPLNNQPNALKFNLNEMREKAAKFAKNEEVRKYVVNILESSKFQADPHKYVDRWVERRGMTEEYRLLEDPALNFFLQNFPCTCKKNKSEE